MALLASTPIRARQDTALSVCSRDLSEPVRHASGGFEMQIGPHGAFECPSPRARRPWFSPRMYMGS